VAREEHATARRADRVEHAGDGRGVVRGPRAVEREDAVLAALPRQRVLAREEHVGHHVPGHVDAVAPAEVPRVRLGRAEEEVARLVDEDPVALLGQVPLAGARARLDVADRDLPERPRDRRRDRRVGVSEREHAVHRVLLEELREPRDHLGEPRRALVRPEAEPEVGRPDGEARVVRLDHPRVEVLPRVHEEDLVPRPERGQERRRLHELRPRAGDDGDPQSVPHAPPDYTFAFRGIGE
jgi:hypothetical protein